MGTWLIFLGLEEVTDLEVVGPYRIGPAAKGFQEIALL